MLGALLVCVAAAAAQPAVPEAAVEAAIGRAAAYLWACHAGDRWPGDASGVPGRDEAGRTALIVYALLTAGQDEQAPPMADTIRRLCEIETDSVFARSFRILALAQLPAQPADSAVERTIAGDAAWLIGAAGADGAYGERGGRDGGGRWDNASTQAAHLAVWTASQRGTAVPAAYWRRAEEHWRRTQTAGGGWSYTTARRSPYGSMTACGVVSLLQCYDELHRDDTIRPDAGADWAPIDRGLDWLTEHFSAWENPGRGPQYYSEYLWALGRLGDAGGHRALGGHDWYAQGAAELVRRQQTDGGWGDDVDTAYALAFLAAGRRAVLVSKLHYDGLWNGRPRDLANLAAWLGRRFERPFRWQVLDIDAPPSFWRQTPVLYISGASAPAFTDEQIARLRDYALGGGLIVSDAARSSAAFNVGMLKVYRRMFPDRPIEPIAPDHPLFSAHRPLEAPMKLHGISNGVRLLAVHSPADLSKAWHLRQADRRADAFQLAANLYFHATDLGEFRRQADAMDAAGAEPARIERTVRVARLDHAGNPAPEPAAYGRLVEHMARQCALRVELSEPIPIAALPAETYAAALMTGTEAFELSEADRRALRAFVNAGGLLVVDAAGGRQAFADAARREVLTLLDDAYPKVGRLSGDGEIYRLDGWPIQAVRYRRTSRLGGAADVEPRLEAVIVGDWPAIVFSAEDLTAGLVGYTGHQLRGYAPDSALALMRNLLLYAARRGRPAEPILGGFVDVQWDPAN
ncbi:MAG: DUF4159 domain-containing protein [Planctomycetes bacterium]|nr:DUF4159 domain-containing protein [Planctomycetota bacterium]